MTFLVGFRIEFRTRLSTPDQSQLIGAVLAEESFVMTGIPSKGDYIDVSYIIGSGSAAVWWPGPLPFMTVHHLEHYAAPVGGDMDPGVQVVCYADPPGDYQAAHLVDYFKDARLAAPRVGRRLLVRPRRKGNAHERGWRQPAGRRLTAIPRQTPPPNGRPSGL